MIENHIDATYAIDLYDVHTREHSARRLRRSQGHQLKQIFCLLARVTADALKYMHICANGRTTEERQHVQLFGI